MLIGEKEEETLPVQIFECKHADTNLTNGVLRMDPTSPNPPSPAANTKGGCRVRSTIAGKSGSATEDSGSDPDITVRGERALWRAVIAQALMDAACGSKKPELVQCKQEALVWLRGTSRDFATVAHHAGFEPEYLRRLVLDALAANCQWRALPGEGTRKHLHRVKKTDRKAGQRR